MSAECNKHCNRRVLCIFISVFMALSEVLCWLSTAFCSFLSSTCCLYSDAPHQAAVLFHYYTDGQTGSYIVYIKIRTAKNVYFLLVMLSLFCILTRVFFYLGSFSFLSVFLSPFSPHALYTHLPCDSLIRARVYSIL